MIFTIGALAGNRTEADKQSISVTDRQRKERNERFLKRNLQRQERDRNNTINIQSLCMSDSDMDKNPSKDDYEKLTAQLKQLMKQNELLRVELDEMKKLVVVQGVTNQSTNDMNNATTDTKVPMKDDSDDCFTHTEKTLLSKRIGELISFEPMTCGINQDISDWLEIFEDKCDRLLLSDVQKFSIVQDLLRDGAKMWFETHKEIIHDWFSFKEKIKAHFELVMGVDVFNRYKQLYNKRRHARESAVDYFYHMIKLCRKADSNMTEPTKIKHLLEGLNLKEKSYVEVRNPQTTERFLQILIECDKVMLEETSRQSSWNRHQPKSKTNTLHQPPDAGIVHSDTHTNFNRTKITTDETNKSTGCWSCGSQDHFRQNCPKNY